jgi:polyisoprenoid-binding protein YceI
MIFPEGAWNIDASHSAVNFTIKHLMISKVRGSFGDFTGQFVSTGKTEDIKLVAAVNVTSVSTNDENRDTHLRSAEFFDTENYPQMKFSSTRVESTKDENVFLLHGDLTIKDVTRPVVFNVEVGGIAVDGYGQTKAAAELTTTINRTDFGLKWNAALETGGVLVSEEVKIAIDAQAVLAQ